MDDNYILISTLNDFIFCPYSIYLHNVYMETDEELYHATPQTRGQNAHETIDTKKASNRADDLQSLPILSEKYIDAPNAKVKMFGNAIHRDADIVYL